eukprot:scaffold22185_cov108-Skeletonema_dohrnii-CCMP3373.AAC.3
MLLCPFQPPGYQCPLALRNAPRQAAGGQMVVAASDAHSELLTMPARGPRRSEAEAEFNNLKLCGDTRGAQRQP